MENMNSWASDSGCFLTYENVLPCTVEDPEFAKGSGWTTTRVELEPILVGLQQGGGAV